MRACVSSQIDQANCFRGCRKYCAPDLLMLAKQGNDHTVVIRI
jgi:hypothetical protein